MIHYLGPNEPDHPNGVRGHNSGAALIHVPASAQQEPGALQRCPVCGQPYTLESLPALPQQPATTPGERLFLCCAQCGTYSVGLLAAQDETGGALESGEPGAGG